MSKKIPNTSTAYSNFIEISIDPALLNNYSNEHSMSSFLASLSSSEEFQKLKLELVKEVLNIIEQHLTPKQQEIIQMTYMEGKTQNEIGEILGKHQTAIHKALRGNIDYAHDQERYGGALKKLRKYCAKSKKIQDILARIREKSEELGNQ